MYRVPRNPQLQRQWPTLLICYYYISIGIFFILISCLCIGMVLIDNTGSPSHTMSSGLKATIFWILLFSLLNAGRLVLGIGLLLARRWAYRGIIALELLTILHMLYRFFVAPAPRIFWIVLGSGIIAGMIVNHLAEPKVRRYFSSSKQ